MTEDERTLSRLRYIGESIRRIADYTEGREEVFRGSLLVQDAVMRRLETLADAAHHLPEDLKARHPSVPWRQVYAFRNIAAHAYEFIDPGRIWEIISVHLPLLAEAVEQELATPPSQT
jgi:uncharacterized protein with HEPN domain